MEYELKEYSKEYEDELINLLLEICVKEHGLKHYENALIDNVKYGDVKKRWILLDGEEIIATACYSERSKKIAEIKKVYIKKEYRHKGIGNKMMNMIINLLKNTEYESIYVGTSDHFRNARSFYEKLGFNFKFYEGDGYILEMKLDKK